ncbi:hypothetical protein QYE76_046089 [Lolium multiflorum]|uniref:Uncharacterized protein n=1 Tax=Lolium multiflorum TaxID=4521 RepID=A0AAD8TPA8_LOLMU|nr:hypothetical protein QYE76_046089 [Lolium multiflorum]
MENYSLFMGAAALMKMAVEMAAVSMEKPSSPLRQGAGTETLVPHLGFAMAAALEGFCGFRPTYEEGASIARGGEEQLDKKLDMELDMKTSHGRAREEREACAREEEVQAGARPGLTGRHAGAPGPRPDPTGRPTGPARRQPDAQPVHTGRPSRGPGPYPGCHPVPGPVPIGPARDDKIVNQQNKDAADLMTWREYEALRNEMRREFRTKDDELKGTVDEIKQTLDATNVTVTGLSDQMTDIQRNIASFDYAVDNLTQQQQQEDEDPSSG